MKSPRKAFTLAEANALLPALETVLADLARARKDLERHVEQLKILEALWGRLVMAPTNPDHAEFLKHREGVGRAGARIRRCVEEEILGRGIRFPAGGLEHGLLDFPTTFEGRWVYLCWRRGEPRISQWHEVDAGFSGRRPIRAAEAARMGIEDDPGDVDDSMLDF